LVEYFIKIAYFSIAVSSYLLVHTYQFWLPHEIPLNLAFLAFEYIHLLSHSYIGNNAIILNAKNYHKQHHYSANTNYSFVTPFWDYWFNTLNSDYSASTAELLLGFLPFYSFMVHPLCAVKKE
jgi:sterol desaturase/sphingolipid hydroxylase (fatty acid hydroxylase superfamily)